MTASLLLSGTEITEANRPAWLEGRRFSLGASECAEAAGLSPYGSPLDLYCRKLGLTPPVEETLAMKIGTLMEPVMAQLYEDETGDKVVRRQFFLRSVQHPFLTGTIDGVTESGRILEYKTIGERSAHGSFGEDGTDEIPDHWVIQATVQMFLARDSAILPDADPSRVDFAVVVGGNRFRRFTVERDDGLIDRLIPRMEAFWNHVTARVPPEASRPSDVGLMSHLYPEDDGPEIEGDEELMTLVEAYNSYGVQAKTMDEARGLARAEILMRMGEAATALLPDLSRIKRKIVKNKGGTYTKDPYQYVLLTHKKPKGR